MNVYTMQSFNTSERCWINAKSDLGTQKHNLILHVMKSELLPKRGILIFLSLTEYGAQPISSFILIVEQ